MADLLLELGCEELPASFVKKAYTDLETSLLTALAAIFGTPFKGQSLGTPRRLIVSITGLPDRQADATKEMRGPGLKAAYAPDGSPTPALVGFCRSNGIELTDLRKDEQYVWANKPIPGRETRVILAELLPKLISELTFEKSMRWGASRMRFARPIRWILATYAGKVVPFSMEGVPSSDTSVGHRFYSPEPFPAATFDALISGLRDRHVEPDPSERRRRIVDGAKQVAGSGVELPDELVEENVFLTEWPTAIVGEFATTALELPAAVLTTAMAKHEKMFPVRDDAGKLTTKFVFIRNSGEDDSVRKGTEWVLNARLADAQFFFTEDSKTPLDGFLEKTAGIVFHTKLGTVRQRADRLHALCGQIAEQTAAPSAEIEYALLAGKYAKADLSTGLVSELASLQGIIGSEYARREKFAEQVCFAIAVQYDASQNRDPLVHGFRTAARLQMAEALDKLVGYLGIGLIPTGSSDPFGLRRSATTLIEEAARWPDILPDYRDWLPLAKHQYARQGYDLRDAEAALIDLFRSRYLAIHSAVRHDLLEAAFTGAELAPRLVNLRLQVVTQLAQDSAFIQSASRPINLVASSLKKGFDCDALDPIELNQLGSETGSDLLTLVNEMTERAEKAISQENAAGLIESLNAIIPSLNAFMDSTMILVEEVPVRTARLNLLARVNRLLALGGAFHKVVLAA